MTSDKVTPEQLAAARAEMDFLNTSIPEPWTRPGEVWLGYLSLDAGVCSKTGKALANSRFCWDRRISIGPGYDAVEWRLGEDIFDSVRHLDGTDCPSGSRCYSQLQCPVCKQYNTLHTKLLPYGDEVTCTNPNGAGWRKSCTYNKYHSIGD